ncbi:hypothetical protein [Natroniella sp. ANB-PHB2]|uniref:hypothetical protein n=1 Tax=Natroniella sp. ANB-PHB2 TaxID=3384444 RepID=UPI0038D487E5
MNNYLVIRVIGDKSIVFPKPKGYYSVEIRPGKFDFPLERKLLERSADAFQEEFNFKIAQRIVTVISANDFYEADEQSEVLFKEVLDCLDTNGYGLAETPLLQTGLVKNLDTGCKSSRLPEESFGALPLFRIEDRQIPKVDSTQALLSLPDTELKLFLLKSYHWLRKSKLESSLQLKNLFRWFAIETLAKTQNQENINPKIMQILGFPLGRIGLCVSKEVINSFKKHSDYLYVERIIKDLLEEIRNFRNDTVHSGFRQWDISRDKLYDFERVLTLAVPRLHKFVVKALFQDIINLEEFWEYIPIIFDEMKYDIKKDLHGTVIYNIKNKNIDKLDKNQRVQFDL